MREDVLVIGGGVAGGATALTLARAGRSVTLVEREATAREKVCGEFLGADATHNLESLGLRLAELGAVPLRRVRLAWRRQVADAALPFRAWGLSRRVLDEALLTEAGAAGVTLRRGCVAQGAKRDAEGWTVRLADGTAVSARILVLATGKHDLRGHPRAAQGRYLGLKVHLHLAKPVDGIALLLCRGGYGGLMPTTDGLANLCVALLPSAAGTAAHDAAALMGHVAASSLLAARLLDGGQPVAPKPLAIASVPFGFQHRDADDADPALFRVGDQATVIPSLAGGGVAMALASGIAAARAILVGTSAPDFHAAWRKSAARPMRWARGAAFALATMPKLSVAVATRVPAAMVMVARQTRMTEPGSLGAADATP